VMFTAVVLGVFDEAIRTARAQIIERVGTLRAFEQTEWTRADSEHWLAEQAFQGALRALETGNTVTASHAASRAKQTVAELAEQALLRLSRVLGGGTFSQRSPFSRWFEDVRALGFLRPPWGLAFDGLYASSLNPD
jgi:alkylation response protein AidB-like acyl-CoA dehydrogenase